MNFTSFIEKYHNLRGYSFKIHFIAILEPTKRVHTEVIIGRHTFTLHLPLEYFSKDDGKFSEEYFERGIRGDDKELLNYIYDVVILESL